MHFFITFYPLQVDNLSKEWAAHADLPQHVVQMLNNFPETLHPMSQFSAAITAMNSESNFAKAYAQGVPKSAHWEVNMGWNEETSVFCNRCSKDLATGKLHYSI